MARDFYQQIGPFYELEQINNIKNFHPVPADYLIVITDIVDSTKAIESGRYRDVNTVGAAVIAAVKSKLKSEDFPYVFGGDGTTFIFSDKQWKRVKSSVMSITLISKNQFDLELRVGAVPVIDVINKGKQVLVGKYCLYEGQSMAFFKGGGLALADHLVKSEYSTYGVKEFDVLGPDLSSLSCRWNPIQSRKGVILSILVLAKDSQTYLDIINKLNQIIKGGVTAANPFNLQKTSYQSIKENISKEKRLHPSLISVRFIARVIEIIFCEVLFKKNWKTLFSKVENYAKKMKLHCDYKKFDDMLRMVIDCSPKELSSIKELLHSLYNEKKINYGLCESDHCLMTCLVGSLKDGDHIHFIDGGNGGYAIAAKNLKEQLAES